MLSLANGSVGESAEPEENPSMLIDESNEEVKEDSSDSNNNNSGSEDEKEKKPPEFIIYEVQEGDTLVGISLKYDVPVNEIQRANFITTGHQIFHRKTLRIPTHGRWLAPQIVKPKGEAELISDFKGRTGSGSEEAKYYLREAEMDMEEAVKNFKDDKAWEQLHGGKFKGSVKVPSENKSKPVTKTGCFDTSSTRKNKSKQEKKSKS